MLKTEHAAEIQKLKQQLKEYKKKKQNKVSAMEDMEDALGKLQKKSREIEDGLQETANTISKWLDRIPAKSKFRATYFEQAKSKFFNPKSSDALEHTREAVRTAKNKLLSLEDDIDALDKKIRSTEEKIWQLSQQSED